LQLVFLPFFRRKSRNFAKNSRNNTKKLSDLGKKLKDLKKKNSRIWGPVGPTGPPKSVQKTSLISFWTSLIWYLLVF